MLKSIGENMKKIITMLIAVLLILTICIGIGSATTGADENYNDHSNEYAQGNQPDPDDIPGMNRAEDRTRNKDN